VLRIFPPEDYDPDSLLWSFENVTDIPEILDEDLYDILSSGKIYQKNCDWSFRKHPWFELGFGPFQLNMGDTIHFMVGQVLGEGHAGVMQNVQALDWLANMDFRLPPPPPPPPLRHEIANHAIKLKWAAQPGDINPETWQDENRLDYGIEPQPFEGYRVYKSLTGKYGPWSLLAEFDIAGNSFNQNTGLAHEYIDQGLLNNLEYYYTVTSFSKPDALAGIGSRESILNDNAIEAIPGTGTPETVGSVAVVPNPYRGDEFYHTYNPPWERYDQLFGWMEQDRRIQFINVPSPCEIKIFTVSGDLVRTLRHDTPTKGYADWNLTSSVGQTISSGIYLFSVRDLKNGKIQTGRFVIIK